MVKFPNVLPIVRPLYTCDSSTSKPTLKKQRSLEAWKNNTVAPITRCHSEDASTTSNFQTSTSNTLDINYNTEKSAKNTTNMYEPVANTCVTTILTRYSSDEANINKQEHETSSRDFNHPSSLNHDESTDSHHHQTTTKATKNNDNKLRANSGVPEKPPRRIKLQKIQQNQNEEISTYSKETPNTEQNKNTSNKDNDNTSTCFVVIGNTDDMKIEDNHPHRVDIEDINRLCVESGKNYKNRNVSIGVQVCPLPPYRLRVLPKSLRKLKSDPEKSDCNKDRMKMCLTALGRWFFSQIGLTIVIVIWALLGAAAFHKTEGPREQEQAEELATLQYNLAVSLATELRQVVLHEPVWLSMVQNYFAKHETLLLNAVSAGYGEGGGGGHIWTYPGCVLFAVSLLTTLGFGAPVPRTTLGRGAAVLFSAIGIPLHFLLVLNIGVLIASKLQAWAIRRTLSGQHQTSCTSSPLSAKSIISNTSPIKQPKWLNWLPIVTIAFYYILGVILFGFVRQRSFADSLMFPLDFTATGGVAKTLGHVRILYALYLEVAVTLAATMVSLLQVSASRGVLNLGLRLGLLTNYT